eukprot:Skav225792  [mRNA]  locus=scaffold2147:139905:145136:+ [translate_table: standard]
MMATVAIRHPFFTAPGPQAVHRRGRSVPPFRCKEMALKEFLQSLQTADTSRKDLPLGTGKYLQQLPVMEHLPELEALGVPMLGPEVLQAALGTDAAMVTCGAAGIQTSLHFDRGDWAAGGQEAKSSIDAGLPAERGFPLFGAARDRSFDVVLEPGDALLLPRWWWHESTAISDGHAVNWWRLGDEECGALVGMKVVIDVVIDVVINMVMSRGMSCDF